MVSLRAQRDLLLVLWFAGLALPWPDAAAASGLAVSASARFLGPGVPATFTAVAPPNATLTWSFDDGAAATGTPIAHAFSSSGTHRATVEALVPGEAAETASADVVVDGTPPVLVGLANHGGVLTIGTADDLSGIATIAIAIDGAAAERLSVQQPVATLSQGTHQITVTLTDRAGNQATFERAVDVERSAPAISVVAPLMATAAAAVTIRVTGNATPLVTIVDGRPTTARGLVVAPGVSHVAKVVDAAGDRASVSFVVERTRRLASIHDPALAGPGQDQLRYAGVCRPEVGLRRWLLLEVQRRLTLLGALPSSWQPTSCYSIRLLRAVQRYQLARGIATRTSGGVGTIGPSTEARLDGVLALRRGWSSSAAGASSASGR